MGRPSSAQEEESRSVGGSVSPADRRSSAHVIWYSFATVGVLGWSVAVPIVLGVLLGRWLDATFPGFVPWTVVLLFAGLILGCLSAGYWVNQMRIDR